MVSPVPQLFCLKIDHGKTEGDTERIAFWRYRIISDECDSYSEYIIISKRDYIYAFQIFGWMTDLKFI